MRILRIIVRYVMVCAGLVCVLDGMLNAYKNAMDFHTETVFIPIRGPFIRMDIGVMLIALGLILSGLLGRIASRKQEPKSP